MSFCWCVRGSSRRRINRLDITSIDCPGSVDACPDSLQRPAKNQTKHPHSRTRMTSAVIHKIKGTRWLGTCNASAEISAAATVASGNVAPATTAMAPEPVQLSRGTWQVDQLAVRYPHTPHALATRQRTDPTPSARQTGEIHRSTIAAIRQRRRALPLAVCFPLKGDPRDSLHSHVQRDMNASRADPGTQINTCGVNARTDV